MLVERIGTLVRGGPGESFEELALAVFRFQYERDPAYRELCDRRGAVPDVVTGWREVPAVPGAPGTGAGPAGGRPASIESSAARESADPEPTAGRDLHRAVIDRSFAPACLAGMDRPPMLFLVPSGGDAPDPGLGLLAEHLLRARAAPDSLVAAGRRGVEVAKARSFLGARQRDRRPTLILGDTTALDRLLAALERRGLRFRLPPGSRVVESGRRGTARPELLARLAEGLGLSPEAVVREYAPAGLASRFYAAIDARGRSRPFAPLPWARVRALDPESGDELPAGTAGMLAVFDLASVGAAAHVLTGHIGTAGEDGFRPAGDPASS